MHHHGLAERKRQLVRDELAECALKLLAFQGFKETTIDQIVTAAGVSRRTFFRYFKSKEDVIIEFLGDLGALVRERLAQRPPDEPPAVALHRALTAFVDEMTGHPEKSLSLARLTMETPELRGRYLDRQADWQAGLADELGRRTGLDPASDLRPALLAGVALAAFNAALARWVQSDGREDLEELVGSAFRQVAPSLSIP